jgi:hypothetical protein
VSSIEFYRSERMARASVEPVQKFNLRLAGQSGAASQAKIGQVASERVLG